MPRGIKACNMTMVLPLKEFAWEVPPEGFAVAAISKDSSPRDQPQAEWARPGRAGADLELLLIPRSSDQPKRYTPLAEQPGLFRRFADLEESEEAVVAFASRFGSLVRPHRSVRPPWNPTTLIDGTLVKWGREVQILRAVVTLQEAISSQDLDAIDALLHRNVGGVTLRVSDKWLLVPRIRLTAEDTTRDARLAVARRVLDHAVTSGLQARSTLKLPDQGPAFQLQMVHGELQTVPANLLGAMWLQFAVALDEGKQFRKCRARDCPTVWFEVSTGPLGVREDSDFCSARCRHTAYRDRKNLAKQMHRDGVSVKEIAKSLKTDVRRVRAWLGKKRR